MKIIAIIIGSALMLFQVLSVIGNLKFGNTLPQIEFSNMSVFFYSLISALSYWLPGMIGALFIGVAVKELREEKASERDNEFSVNKNELNSSESEKAKNVGIESFATTQNETKLDHRSPVRNFKFGPFYIVLIAVLVLAAYFGINYSCAVSALDDQEFDKAKKHFDMLLISEALFPEKYAEVEAGLLASGNSGASSNISSDPSIYEELTGIDENKVFMTVDGNEIPASLYLYWALSITSNVEYEVQMYNNYYNMYEDMLESDKSLKWDAQFREDATMEEYIRDLIHQTVIRLATMENMAEENGIALTEEDLAAIEAYKVEVAESYREQLVKESADNADLSAEEVLDRYLEYLGINAATFERLTAAPYYFTGLSTAVATEGTALYLDNTGFDEYGFYADHILLATMDTSTYTSYEQSVIDEKRALAEDILARLNESDDPVALFAELADEYSEDPGRETNPTGYIFTPGQMVAEFEEATKKLQSGEISGIVQSNYGFHIILRRDLSEGLAAYPDQKAALVESYLNDLVSAEMESAEVVYAEELAEFNLPEFYKAYNEVILKKTMSDDILNSSNDDTTSENASVSAQS